MQDKKKLEEIYEHFGNTVRANKFVEMYKSAISKPYGFLHIDTDSKENIIQFCSGFNKNISLLKKV